MKKHTEVLILGFLMIVCLITLVVVLATSCKNNFTPGSSGGSETLYITAETPGLLTGKEITLPTLKDPNKRFPGGAVLVYLSTPANQPINQFYANAETMLKKFGINTFQYWIQFDVTKTNKKMDCTTSVDTCEASMGAAIKFNQNLVKSKPITGVYIDKESSQNMNYIVEAMNSLDVKDRAWAGGYKNCASNCPLGTKPDCTKDWYCLGESYTDMTADLYLDKPCGQINVQKLKGYWDSPTRRNGMGIPMVCVRGNCQNDLSKTDNKHPKTNYPLDERLNEEGLKDLFNNTTGSLALWFGGDGPTKSPDSRC